MHVHVPIRVALVEPVTGHELTLLERAVGDACRTALLTARREFLDVRGSGRRIVVDRPDPVFTGRPAPQELRERAARAATRGVTAGISASGLLRRRPVPSVRAEPFDASRLGRDEDGATYRIPSYDRPGKEEAVRFFHQRGDRPAPGSLRPAAGTVLTVNEAAAVAWSEHLDRSGAVWQPEIHGYPGYAGLVSAEGRQRRALVWISDVTAIDPVGQLPKGSYRENWQELDLLTWQPRPGGRVGFRQATVTGGLAPYHDLERTERQGTVEEIEKLITELLDAGHEPAGHPLRQAAARRRYAELMLGGATEPTVLFRLHGDRRMFAVLKATTLSPIRFVTALPPAGLESRAASPGFGPAASGRRPASGTPAASGSGTKAAPAPARAPVPGTRLGPTPKPKPAPAAPAPGTKPAVPAKPERGATPPGTTKPEPQPGSASRPGPGVPAPPPTPGEARPERAVPGAEDADGAAAGGSLPEGPERVRPGTDAPGEDVVCAAYEGEPALTALVSRQDALAQNMRRIARLLDVDECAHPGMFTLNCARAVAVRARGVGLASVRSPVTTQVAVRADGGGNNGFVDVRPGQAPEVKQLRILARAVALLRRLADDIVAAYQLAENAPLIRPHPGTPGPQAAAWALRFLTDVHGVLSESCMHLYAETCRVLLLQQLRSSGAAIAQRRGPNAEETLEHFARVLDILCGSAVKLLVLRRAVRHAERIGAIGTVREVLSRRQTRYHAGDREYDYAKPAPIGEVNPQTLSELVDARIERRGTGYAAVEGGRVWTPEDLERGILSRRTLVNQVDPLYFQVEDIERVFASAQGDPGFLRRHLTELLGTLAAANEEMTRKATEAHSGAFFALEASQFVARTGGKDARGLSFALSGIHAMSDDELRPYAGDVPEYGEGVNLAIDRKGGFDAVKQVFATAGITVLALLCAPLGATLAGAVTSAVSLGLAVHENLGAQEKVGLYRALEDPDALQRWQDVELAELMALIGLAFSVFDVGSVAGGAKAIARGATEALQLGRQAGARGAVRAVTGGARRTIVADTTEQMLRHALREAVTALAVTQVMDVLAARVLGPVVTDWARDQGLLHGTSDRPGEGGE